ncbi:MAG: Lrp/AsnC family transcriptional regulator [Ruminococcaceae bacterium]|nr:Lrp/AsnC family transcriptional regulator [Oscillospiraceae bacterium]
MIKKKILSLLEKNGRLTPAEIGVMVGINEQEAAAYIAEMEADKVIVGYSALIDWDKADKSSVHALIEIKVIPQKSQGFDSVAKTICKFEEVKNLYLMSGGFDLAVMVEGKSLRDVAMFVSERLSFIDGVTATATHFVLKKYKDSGVFFGAEDADERGCLGI